MKSDCGDKMIVRLSYLHNGITYTGKTTSLYWIRAQEPDHQQPLSWFIQNIEAAAIDFSWSLQWRHNEHDGVSNHQLHDCLLNRLSRRRSKKTSKLRVTGLCAGNSPVTGEFPAQMANNAEHVSIWWRHRVIHPLNVMYASIPSMVYNQARSSAYDRLCNSLSISHPDDGITIHRHFPDEGYPGNGQSILGNPIQPIIGSLHVATLSSCLSGTL